MDPIACADLVRYRWAWKLVIALALIVFMPAGIILMCWLDGKSFRRYLLANPDFVLTQAQRDYWRLPAGPSRFCESIRS